MLPNLMFAKEGKSTVYKPGPCTSTVHTSEPTFRPSKVIDLTTVDKQTMFIYVWDRKFPMGKYSIGKCYTPHHSSEGTSPSSS